MSETETILCWHFINADRRLGYDDNREIIEGETLSVECKPKLCEAGLHGCIRAIDALQYANSFLLSRVGIWGEIDFGGDKLCGRHRKTLQIIDAEKTILEWTRRVALDVSHLWNMPDVVRHFLTIGENAEEAARATWAARAARAAEVAEDKVYSKYAEWLEADLLSLFN